MLLKIDTADRRSIYQQVADGIKTLIASGDLREGESLPSVRQLAGDLGVNLNTIAAAYRELQAEGLIAVKHGSGAMVNRRSGPRPSGDELRRPLRTALTGLVLAGLERAQILGLVGDELETLLKGVK